MDFFTSDTHFFHRNQATRRGFDTVEGMHEVLTGNWNRVVSSTDRVFVLGDFAMGMRGGKTKQREQVEEVLRSLNGQKFLVVGNHDHTPVRTAQGWQDVRDLRSLRVGEQWIEMLHFPMRSWNRMHQGAWHLHGHTHGNLMDDMGVRNSTAIGKMMDVGVDVHDLTPVSFDQVSGWMKHRVINVVDHHSPE